MPRGKWTEKDERQYEHIKESAEERGQGKRAEEIAARTVNKRRRTEGRTPNRRTEGTGNPQHRLATRTKNELVNVAKKMHITGTSRLTKDELIEAIEKKRK
ncbi:MAG: Rho termination factor N-terminal domain-containing protein [Acidobacteriota bacterium]